jgi:von Willebrand factor A domain-containing protein 8
MMVLPLGCLSKFKVVSKFHSFVLWGLREHCCCAVNDVSKIYHSTKPRPNHIVARNHIILQSRAYASAPPSIIRIGNVERNVTDPSSLTMEQQRKIPRGYLASFDNDPVAQLHLQWLVQKDLLQQDCILVGYMGGDTIRRRRIAMAYAELTQQPVELLTISQDTSESDLKQRRSIVNMIENDENLEKSSTATTSSRIIFQDQAPVRAAILGHLLIIDGLHRAERNVLPTLNNLLENREMPLEDGRLLVSSQRYKFLKEQQTDDPMNQFLVPVHENFKVLALLSHDPNSSKQRLDPPVRSRFQIQRIDSISTDVLLNQILAVEEEHRAATSDIPGTNEQNTNHQNLQSEYITNEVSAKQLVMFATAMSAETMSEINKASSRASDSAQTNIACRIPFPLNTIPYLQRLLNRFPQQPVTDLLERMYPYGTSESRLRFAFTKWPIAVTSRDVYHRICRDMKLLPTSAKSKPMYDFDHSEIIADAPRELYLHFVHKQASESQPKTIKIKASSGGLPLTDPKRLSTFVSTAGLKHVITAMLQEHSVDRDILLVSPKGEGKSVAAEYFCATVGYHAHLFPLYKEMTAMDLLVRRGTTTTNNNNKGVMDSDTHPEKQQSSCWSESPLLLGARTGQVCILDGIEKLSRDCLATLQGFLTDREVHLPDGTKYLQPSSSDHASNKVHGSFRVIALASIEETGRRNAAPTWLSEDTTSMFSTIAFPAPTRQCISQILAPFSKLAASDFEKLLSLYEKLLVAAEDCGVSSLSIRTMKRIVRKGRFIEGGGLYEQLCSCLLTDLLPPTKRAALESLLRSCRILPNDSQEPKKKMRVKFDKEGESVKIGALVFSPLVAKHIELVPNPLFWDIPSHIRAIQTLLSEWTTGERAFLLLGNQGTGKNKICDRLCQLLNHEREYIQLHRDTTIGQLTISPSLENGQIVWKDSPLIRAVVNGRALVIDEADKAPLEVVAVLKSLVEDGELLLADGRRITRQSTVGESTEGSSIIHHQILVEKCQRVLTLFMIMFFFREYCYSS